MIAFVATTDDDTSYTIIAGGKRIASSSRALKLNQYSDTYIAAESTGYYALYNFKGKKLTKTYQNAFDEVGQNIYSHWINDKEYEYIRCDADGTTKVLFRVKADSERRTSGSAGDRRRRRVRAPRPMSTRLPALTASAQRWVRSKSRTRSTFIIGSALKTVVSAW